MTSGYLVKIEVFIPANPHDPDSITLAAAKIKAISHPSLHISNGTDAVAIVDAAVGKPRWIARHKQTTDDAADAVKTVVSWHSENKQRNP